MSGQIREIHFAKVLDNVDPDQRGGLKVQVDSIVDGAALSDDYIPPSFPFAGNDQGFFFLPEVGEFVEVEIVADKERATETLEARWRTVLYSDNDAIPAEVLSDPANRAVIKFGPEKYILWEKAKDLVAMVSLNVRLGLEDAPHPLVRGDTYNAELDTYLTAEDTFETAETTRETASDTFASAIDAVAQGLIAMAPSPIVPGAAFAALGTPLAAAVVAYRAAIATYSGDIATFQSATGAFKGAQDSWLSTRCKTE